MWRPTLLVGVGGASGWEALAWAVDEAAGYAGDVIVAHACPPDSPLASAGGRVAPGLLEIADPGLARAVAGARARLGGNRVTLRISTDAPADALLDQSGSADLVVMGGPTGHAATVHRVVTEAPCPSVVVHPVSMGRDRPFAGHVVVGVCPGPAARAALELGFWYAGSHRLPLAAVHVSADGAEEYWYDERTLTTHFAAEPAALDLLAVAIEPLTHRYPRVPVKRAVLAGAPSGGLVRAAEGARLLVVGDHGSRLLSHAMGSVSHRLQTVGHGTGPVGHALAPVGRGLSVISHELGSVSHAVIRRAGCPVAVVRADQPHGRFP